MLRLIILVTALLIALAGSGLVDAQAPQPGADGLGDPLRPQAGNGGYDVERYVLALTWDPTTNTLSGSAQISAIATQNLSALNLDFIGFEIDYVQIAALGSTNLADFSRAGQELTVTPAMALPEGTGFTVIIQYAGTPTSWTITDDFAYVSPLGNAGWFPCNDHPRDKAAYHIMLTVPQGLEVVASADWNWNHVDEHDTIRYAFTSRHPAYNPTVVIGDFAAYPDVFLEPKDPAIWIHSPQNGTAEENVAARQVRIEDYEQTRAVIDFFEARFGPFPYEAYQVVILDWMPDGPFGPHALAVLDRERYSDQVLAHETAHQWFFDSVSPSSFSDMWLVEGFATYAEVLWVEHTTGQDLLVDYYDVIRIMGPPGRPPADNLFDHSVYGRGAWTLKALHLRVGDDVFWRIVRTYTERYRDSSASTTDFIAVAEEISGEDLGDFFQSWLYDTVAPPVPELGLGGE